MSASLTIKYKKKMKWNSDLIHSFKVQIETMRWWIFHQNQQKRIQYFDDRSNTVVAKEKEKGKMGCYGRNERTQDEEIKIKHRERERERGQPYDHYIKKNDSKKP